MRGGSTCLRITNDKAAGRRPVIDKTDAKKPGKFWSGRRDSNPRPRPWQGRALPLSYTRIREDRRRLLAADAQTYAKCRWRMQQLDCISDRGELIAIYGPLSPILPRIMGQNSEMSPLGWNRSLPDLFHRIANYCHGRHLIAQAMLEAAKFFRHRARFT